MKNVNERFRYVRKMFSLSQKEFASEIGISQAHVSSIERCRDNPSESLLKLICFKFSINDKWLFDGIESPGLDWDMTTNNGAHAKYNNMRASFECLLRNLSGDDLFNTVEAFACLVSIFSAPKLKDERATEFLKYAFLIMDGLEKMLFGVSIYHTAPPKNDAAEWIRYRKKCEDDIGEIKKNIENATNMYLVHHGEDMKL